MYFLILFFTLFCGCETFASLEEVVDPYEKGQFLPKTATSFNLDESALSLPTSADQKDLVRTMVTNDRNLMFYLSKNRGLTFDEKLFYRLQAFQYVLTYYNTELNVENEAFFVPLFKLTGGDWIRLQGIVWGDDENLYFITLPTKKIKKGVIGKYSLKYVSYLKEAYYRFLSKKERRIRDEEITFAPRDQKERSDRTPKPSYDRKLCMRVQAASLMS